MESLLIRLSKRSAVLWTPNLQSRIMVSTDTTGLNIYILEDGMSENDRIKLTHEKIYEFLEKG